MSLVRGLEVNLREQENCLSLTENNFNLVVTLDPKKSYMKSQKTAMTAKSEFHVSVSSKNPQLKLEDQRTQEKKSDTKTPIGKLVSAYESSYC